MSRHLCEHPFESNRIDGTADFLPEWDVPALGKEITTALAQEISSVREQPKPDPKRRIHLLRGPAGYGKTHLFGRVKHEQGEQVQFVFVSGVPDGEQAVGSICFQLVETLFHASEGKVAPLRSLLARLLRESFSAYLDALPSGLRARSTELRQALASDPATVLDIVAAVAELAPYHTLADSIRQRIPDVPADVVRAFVLGLSPSADDARAWLRGEASQLDEERTRKLRLSADSPDPLDVLRTVCTLLARIDVPLVLCLDQVDQVFVVSTKAFQDLTSQLMNWLGSVPNLIVVLGCVDAAWKKIEGEAALAAFIDRIRQHPLLPLTAATARELVIRRMRSWEDFDAQKGEGWPFDLVAVEKLAQHKPTSPRGYIDRCRLEFDKWNAGRREGLITLDAEKQKQDAPLSDLFRQEWDKLLASTKASLKNPADYQDVELWAGVEQALRVAQVGQYVPAGLKFEGFQNKALKPSPSDPRPSAQVHLVSATKRTPLVLAVNKKDSGQAFSRWYDALVEAVGGNIVGTVVVWPKAKLGIGKGADSYKAYQERVAKKALRPFALDDNLETFAQLECLRKLIADAEAGMTLLDGKAISANECRKLVVETKVLAELPLFEILFQNWPAVEADRAPAPAGQASETTTAPPSSPTTPPARQAPQPAVAVAPAPVRPAPSPTHSGGKSWADEMLAKVVDKLRTRGQPVQPVGVEIGPTFVRLKVEPLDDTDFAKVKKQADNLKLHLGLEVKPVIGNRAGFISIDIVRPDRQPVPLAPLLAQRSADLAGEPAFPVGVDVAGVAHWVNLAEPGTCHLLIAGTTGSGKSQLLKSLIATLCNQLGPDLLQFVLIDPKQVTFNFTGASPYLAHPVVHEAQEALPRIETCFHEMERRYSLLRAQGKEHIGELSREHALPRWVVVFDEFADLMLGDKATKKEMETFLKRLGAKARAAGIHLILGTQRPEASVVTLLLRANLPGRVSLQVASERESKLILDEPDAAHLLDKGDLLLKRGGTMLRLQGPLVTREELEQALRFH